MIPKVLLHFKMCLHLKPECPFLSKPGQAAWSLEGKLWVTRFNGKPPVYPFVFSSEKSVVSGRIFLTWQFGYLNEARFLCV